MFFYYFVVETDFNESRKSSIHLLNMCSVFYSLSSFEASILLVFTFVKWTKVNATTRCQHNNVNLHQWLETQVTQFYLMKKQHIVKFCLFLFPLCATMCLTIMRSVWIQRFQSYNQSPFFPLPFSELSPPIQLCRTYDCDMCFT